MTDFNIFDRRQMKKQHEVPAKVLDASDYHYKDSFAYHKETNKMYKMSRWKIVRGKLPAAGSGVHGVIYYDSKNVFVLHAPSVMSWDIKSVTNVDGYGECDSTKKKSALNTANEGVGLATKQNPILIGSPSPRLPQSVPF